MTGATPGAGESAVGPASDKGQLLKLGIAVALSSVWENRAAASSHRQYPPPATCRPASGRDDRGIELLIIAVPDNRDSGGLAVIPAMPAGLGKRGG